MNGELKLIVHDGCIELGKKIEKHLQKLRKDKTSLIVPITIPRFSNGEAKAILEESVRGKDLFIITDVFNYNLTYKMNTIINHYSPDDYFMDITRIVAAAKGHTNRTNVVMPFLYEARQHRRKGRESLDCSIALKTLHELLEVHTIITVDVHDPDICNALPLSPFENIYPTGAILKDFVKKEKKKIDFKNLIIISPDAGAIQRANFFANVFQSELGIFTKFRDYTKVTEGRNQITMHRYSGPDLEGRDTIVIDDMIASGESMLDVAIQLKERNAKNVYLISTFPLFTSGIEKFKEAYKKKLFTKLYTTNLIYISEEYKKEPWLEIVDCSLAIAKVINAINLNKPISDLLDDKKEIAKSIENVIK
jgi:ribose-phosphate pyrophosphokinase